MLQFLVNFIWWLLAFIGIYRDLPPIPDALPEKSEASPKRALTPSSNRDKHVTFSPVKNFIPEYGFNCQPTPDKPLPQQLLKEVQSFEHTGSEQVVQLYRILYDLKEELEDARKENSRLVNENSRLKEKELTDSRKSENE